ncbi:MAG: class I SAM-dependent methyltransferase [Henriciella sp.]|nr:class I SAM-dependent methyltransferase [Henriciella sp.]
MSRSISPIEGSSTAGYANEADDLFERYEARRSADVHKPWSHFFPASPARILDIGAGTGRDAAWFTSLGHHVTAVEPVDEMRTRAQKLHPEPEITWLKDILPDLPDVRALNQTFDMILMHAVWMHLTEPERTSGMATLASLLASGGRIVMSQRHGPVPKGRRMFEIGGEETISLAAQHGLKCLYNIRTGSTAAENMALRIEWTRLVFEKN